MEEDEGYSSSSMFLAFLFGGIVGAGLALLLTPQSGRETRNKMKEFADGVREKATDYIDEAKDKVSSFVDEGKGYYEEKKSLVKSAVEAGKEAYEKEKEKLSKGQNA